MEVCKSTEVSENIKIRDVKKVSKVDIFSESKALISMAVPILITNLLQTLMTTVDVVMAGHLGAKSLAAIGVAAGLYWPFTALFMGILFAVSPVVAKYYGSKKHRAIVNVTQQMLYFSQAAALVCMVSINIIVPLVIHIMVGDEHMRDIAIHFILYISLGIPFLFGFVVLRCMSEGLQYTIPLTIILFVTVLINIPLNWAFMYGKFGMPHLGAAGCGLASAIAVTISFVLMVIFIRFSKRYKVVLNHMNQWNRWHWRTIKKVLKLGIPMGIGLGLEISLFGVISLLLVPLGATVVSGNQIIMNISTVIFMLPLSIGAALTSRVGFHLGEKNEIKARVVVKLATFFNLLISISAVIIIYVLKDSIIRIYNNEDKNIINTALELLAFFPFILCFDALQFNFQSALRGYQESRFQMIASLFSFWVISIPLGYILTYTDYLVPHLGARGFMISLSCGLILVGTLFFIKYIHLSNSYWKLRNAKASLKTI